MSRLVCLVGEEKMVTWANQSFDKVLREHKLPKNTVVICGHGRLTFWRSTNRKDRWMVEIEKENELGLEIGLVFVDELIKKIRARFPWATHIELWICNPLDVMLPQQENVNLTFFQGIGNIGGGRLRARTKELPARKSARRPK